MEDLGYDNYSQGLWFVAINAITFCLGMVTVVLATLIAIAANTFRSEAVKASFVLSVRYAGWVSSVLFFAGLLFFNASYAMYGYAKMLPWKPEMFWTAVILDLGLVGIFVKVFVEYRKAKSMVRPVPELMCLAVCSCTGTVCVRQCVYVCVCERERERERERETRSHFHDS